MRKILLAISILLVTSFSSVSNSDVNTCKSECFKFYLRCEDACSDVEVGVKRWECQESCTHNRDVCERSCK